MFSALMLLLMAAQALLPVRTRSDLENRVLTSRVELTADALLSGALFKQIDAFAADQLPLREQLVKLNAVKDAALFRVRRGDILLGKGGRMFESLTELPLKTLKANLDALDALKKTTGLPLSLVLIPPASYVYGEDMPRFFPLADRTALAGEAARRDYPILDMTQTLQESRGGDPLYYRTDHHMTLSGARAVYAAMRPLLNGQADGVPAAVRGRPGFLGSLYQRAPSPFVSPDTLFFAEDPRLSLSVAGKPVQGLYDAALMESPNRYAALFYNNPAELLIENPAGKGSLLVIRDSHANCLLPLIAKGYQKVYAVNPRYLTGTLPDFVKDHPVEEILCVYGYNTLITDRNLIRLGLSR